MKFNQWLVIRLILVLRSGIHRQLLKIMVTETKLTKKLLVITAIYPPVVLNGGRTGYMELALYNWLQFSITCK
jgi:hypothetical protein